MKKETAVQISALEKMQSELALGAMQYPKVEPFDHGVLVGRFQGLGEAINLLKSIDKDEDE